VVEGATPRQRDVKQGGPNTGEGPYETPVVLRTKRRAQTVQLEVDDTEAEDSEIEREVRKVIMKRKKATKVSSIVY
jgi:hypothetical protein